MMSETNQTQIITASQKKWDQLAQNDIYQAIWCPKGGLNSNWDEAAKECLEIILQNIPLETTWKTLELGCGIGRLTKLMAFKCKQVVGVDFSPEMIEQGKLYLASIPNVSLFINNGKDLKLFQDNSFDFLYSMITLQHIPSLAIIENYILEIERVLKPGGFTKLQTHQGNSFKNSETSLTLYDGHITKEMLQHLFSKAGFLTISIEIGLIHSEWIWITARKV